MKIKLVDLVSLLSILLLILCFVKLLFLSNKNDNETYCCPNLLEDQPATLEDLDKYPTDSPIDWIDEKINRKNMDLINKLVKLDSRIENLEKIETKHSTFLGKVQDKLFPTPETLEFKENV